MTTEPTNRDGRTTVLVVAAALVLFSCALAGVVVLLVPPTTEQQVSAIRARNPAFNMEDGTPNADAAALESTQEVQLSGYGWVDKSANIARIPIDRAMELIITQQAEPSATPSNAESTVEPSG